MVVVVALRGRSRCLVCRAAFGRRQLGAGGWRPAWLQLVAGSVKGGWAEERVSWSVKAGEGRKVNE